MVYCSAYYYFGLFQKELDVGAKKAVVIYVPVRQMRGYQKIQVGHIFLLSVMIY